MGLSSVAGVRIASRDSELSGRVLEISSSSGKFTTPTRAPTSTESNARVHISFEEPWDNPLFEVTNRFKDHSELAALHRKNGAFARRRREIAAQFDKFRGYSLVKYYAQIQFADPLTERDIRTLVDLQIESGAEVISIPETSASCTPAAFAKNVDRTFEYIESMSTAVAPMPYLSIAQDHRLFEQKLRALAEREGSVKSLGIRFASPLEYRPNYMSLAEFGEHTFWVHLSQGKKYPNWKSPVAQLLALARFGVDTMATEIPQPPVQDDGDRRKPAERIRGVRYLEAREAIYSPLGQVDDAKGTLPCDAPCCKSLDVAGFVATVQDKGPPDELQLRVSDRAKIHDVYSSTAELARAQVSIREGTYAKFLGKKRGIRQHGSVFVERGLGSFQPR
jgi:hypothetical protein